MHKFTLLLKKESRSIIAFAILSAILVTLLLLDFYGAQNETYIEDWEKKASNLLIYKRLCKI